MVPDFHLVDVNPNSATYNTEFSPRDLLGQTGGVVFRALDLRLLP